MANIEKLCQSCSSCKIEVFLPDIMFIAGHAHGHCILVAERLENVLV